MTWSAVVAAVLVGLLAPPFDAARSSLCADLLTGERYVVGNALLNAVVQAAQLVGFVVGGALVVTLGVEGALLVDAGTFALSAGLRVPVSVVWTTPGLALLPAVAELDGGFPAAVGAFVVVGALVLPWVAVIAANQVHGKAPTHPALYVPKPRRALASGEEPEPRRANPRS